MLILSFCLAFTLTSTSHCQSPVKIGAIGDSLLDEHFDQGIGYSMNALELLVFSGRVDAGRTASQAGLATWPDVRRTGFEHNWALAGSTTASLLADNQHTNLANQISVLGITKAVMIVGANDLFPVPPTIPTTGFPGSSYEAIYSGLAPQALINAVANQAVNNVVLAAQTLKLSGVDLVVATVPDYGISPFAKFFYPNIGGREAVDDVVEAWNTLAINQLTQTVGVPVVDIYSLSKDIWGDHGNENTSFELGGVNLNLTGTGGVSFVDVINGTYDPLETTSDTPDAFVHDGIHPNTTIGGIFGNLFMEAFNQEYGDTFTLFSEQQILNFAGPNLGSLYVSDTLQDSLGGKSYQDYIFPISAVPEPSALWLVSAVGIGWLTCRRRSPV
jgi:hypothetical protein